MRVWLYARSARDEDGAIDRQIWELKGFAAIEGYEVVGMSQDIGSGLNINKGLRIARAAAVEGKIDALLITDIARIGRDMEKNMAFIKMLNECGVKIIALNGSIPKLSGIENFITEYYTRLDKKNTLSLNKVFESVKSVID